jgi:UDP-N-acetylmuramyl pentapeptide phosphotransferase/UDP-N-acetylglucosamine-1-phosphate transferase
LRLVVQLLTGLALALQVGWPLPLALPAAVLAAALINAINFMDGLDGLVASCLAIWLALAALLLSAPAPALLAAALLGFLAWNWSPARLFMGDVGSTYLGAVMAGVLLRAGHAVLGGAGWGSLVALLLAALPLLADACSCLLRRLFAGQRLWQAHRLHLYQRLQQAGWSHGRVAGTYSGMTLGLALLGVVIWRWNGAVQLGALLMGVVLTLALGRLLERRWAVPFD